MKHAILRPAIVSLAFLLGSQIGHTADETTLDKCKKDICNCIQCSDLKTANISIAQIDMMTADDRFKIMQRFEQSDQKTKEILRQSLESFRLDLEKKRQETEQERAEGTIQRPSYESNLSRYMDDIKTYKAVSESLPK